jgi:hypothetical protein
MHAVLTAALLLAPAADTRAPTGYVERHLEGWRLFVHKELLADADLSERVFKVLGQQLHQTGRVVPAEALDRLRRVTIWVELNHPKHPCMCYHPSAEWLRANGMDPRKAGCVEVANARNFLAWTVDQPWMVLHELAHAYHHQVLGFDNAEVAACYDAAVKAKSYESVLHVGGGRRRAYALTDAKEYFAEASEAFFGCNDFYPFVRAELKEHDPKMFATLEKLWGVRK